MKKIFVAFVISFIFVLFSGSVSARAELEKDVKDKASDLKANKTVTNVLNSADEEAWYRFEVTETGSQQFSFKSKGVDGSRFWMGIYVVDDDGVLQQAYVERMKDGADGNLSTEFSYQKETVIYVNITNAYGDGTGIEYSLTANTSTEPVKNCVWATKDSDKYTDANKITSKNRVCSILNTGADEDWYVYEVKNKDSFSFYIKSLGVNGARFWLGIYVEDNDGVLQQKGAWRINDGADGYTSDELGGYTKGTKIYVNVTNAYGDATGVRYILAVNDTVKNSSSDDASVSDNSDVISILAGTNVVVGKADPGAKVSVKYGKKTYTATADADGIYRVKTAKLKKGKSITIWQTVNKQDSEKTTVKIVSKY